MPRRRDVSRKLPRTLLVKDEDGELEVQLPPGARVTFGPDIPFTPRDQNRSEPPQRSYSLRIYTGSGNDTLSAVFSRVQSFRDITIQAQRYIVQKVDTQGVQYLAKGVLLGSQSIPACWSLHRRHTPTGEWSPAEHTCRTREEALEALEQMIAATARLRDVKRKTV